MAAFAQFDDIFRGLETSAGRLRLQEGGLGYKITSEDPSASSSGTYTLEVEKMRSFEWIKVARGYQLRIVLRANHEKRRETFDGFHRDDYDRLSAAIVEYYQKRLEQVEVSTRGWNWGLAKIVDNEVKFLVRDKLAFEIPVEQIANSNVAGKDGVSMEFINSEQQQPVANTGTTSNGSAKGRRARGDQLTEMRFHIPGNVERGVG
ncbi:hypothetical protein L7F22_028467 [Adiantum nelumboides]|nr:hypothetical protein [Adiantum nelumboides]